MKKELYTLVLLVNLSLSTFAQSNLAPKYSNEFLAIGVGADALGLGNAQVARTSNVFSSYWNPAGLISTSKWLEVGAMHSEYFAGITKYDNVSIAHPLDDKSAAGFSFIRFAVDDIPNTTSLIDNNGNIDYDNITLFSAADYAFIFSYARKTNIPNLTLGGNFKIIHRKVGDFAKSWGFGLDAGAQYQYKNNWKFGFVARDITSTFNTWIFSLDQNMKETFLATGNTLPQNGVELTLPRFIFAAYKKQDLGSKGIYASAEVDLDMTTDGKRNTLISNGLFSIDPHAGFEIGYKSYVVTRFGIMNMQYLTDYDDSKKLNVMPTLGLGLNYKNFALDYAMTNIGNSAIALYSHVFSLRMKLDRPKNMLP